MIRKSFIILIFGLGIWLPAAEPAPDSFFQLRDLPAEAQASIDIVFNYYQLKINQLDRYQKQDLDQIRALKNALYADIQKWVGQEKAIPHFGSPCYRACFYISKTRELLKSSLAELEGCDDARALEAEAEALNAYDTIAWLLDLVCAETITVETYFHIIEPTLDFLELRLVAAYGNSLRSPCPEAARASVHLFDAWFGVRKTSDHALRCARESWSPNEGE